MIVVNVFSDNEHQMTLFVQRPDGKPVAWFEGEWDRAVQFATEADPENWNVDEVIEMLSSWGWKINQDEYPVFEVQY